MKIEISATEAKKASHPHELFLVNLITNHILLFVSLLGFAKQYPWTMLVTPVISLVVLSYLLLRARRSQQSDSWFVMCHWQQCARRSKGFIVMLMIVALVMGGLLLSVSGDISALRPGHYAIGGVAILPTMLSVLVLIIMESDAVHQARSGTISDAIAARFPAPA